MPKAIAVLYTNVHNLNRRTNEMIFSLLLFIDSWTLAPSAECVIVAECERTASHRIMLVIERAATLFANSCRANDGVRECRRLPKGHSSRGRRMWDVEGVESSALQQHLCKATVLRRGALRKDPAVYRVIATVSRELVGAELSRSGTLTTARDDIQAAMQHANEEEHQLFETDALLQHALRTICGLAKSEAANWVMPNEQQVNAG